MLWNDNFSDRSQVPPRRARTSLFVVAPVVSVMAALGSVGLGQSYRIVPIPTLGGNNSFGHGINDAGLIAGYAQNASGQNRALLFDGTTSLDLGTLGGADSQAFAINNLGQIVGYSKNASAQERAFVYSGGTMTPLGTLGGASSYGFGINAGGQITGGSTTVFDTAYHAFRYTAPTMSDLGAMGGPFGSSEGAGIDDDGTVVGYTSVSFTSQQAFVYRNNTMTLLGTLGGNYSYAQAIRNGVIVGGAFLPGDTAFHAARWSNGTISDLGTLPQLPSSIAYGLNATGQIVGKSDAGTESTERAFLYLGNSMLDLNDLVPVDSGWTIRQARGINSSGQIVGFGTFEGRSRGFRLDLTGKVWANSQGGDWASAGNWFSPGVPSTAQVAAFAVPGAYQVTVNGTVAAGTVSIAEGSVSIAVAALGHLSAGDVEVRTGAALSATGMGTLTGGVLRVAEGATFSASGGRSTWTGLDSRGAVRAAAGGEIRLVSTGPAAVTAELTIDGAPGAWTGRIDLADRAVVIDYTELADSPLATVADQVRTARGPNGSWGGYGIASSLADASSLGVGFAEASAVFSQFPASFAGRTVDSSAVLLRLTRSGDANLDGAVGLGDFSLLASNFNAPGFWSAGDFNYDGIVGIGDFSILAANYNTSLASQTGRRGLVPEPAAAGLLAAIMVSLFRPRRASGARRAEG